MKLTNNQPTTNHKQELKELKELGSTTSSPPSIGNSDEIENQYVTTDEDGNEIQTKAKKPRDTRPMKICAWYAREVEKAGEKNGDAYIKGGFFILKETLKKYPETEIKQMLEYHLENNQPKFWHIGNALSGKSIVKFLNQ